VAPDGVGDNLPVVRIYLVCVAIAAALLAPGLLVGPSLDAALFAEVASRVRSGATLYVDVWDHKPPGIYLLLSIGQALIPWIGPWLVSWLLSVLATAGTAALIHGIGRRIGLGQTASLLGTIGALLILAQYFTALGGGLTEPFAALLLVTALQLSLRAWGRDDGAASAAAAASLLAVALLVSVQSAPALAPILWVAVARSSYVRRRAAVSVLAFAGPLILAAGWLALTGSLGGAIDAVVTYAAAYRAVAGMTGAALGGPVLAWTLLVLLFLAVPAALGAAQSRRRPGPARDLGVACLAWIGLAIVSFLVQGRLFAHYVIPLAIPMGLLVAFGVERLRGFVGMRRTRLLIPIALSCVVSATASVLAGAMELSPISADHDRAVISANVIDQESAQTDRVWIWGNEPELYLQSGRQSVTAYPYLYALVTPGYTTPRLIETVLASLQSDPPKLIVDAGSSAPGEPGFQSLLIPRPLASDGRDLDLLDPLRAFVRERYREVSRQGGWVVYARRD
jgi:hypothetical protein